MDLEKNDYQDHSSSEASHQVGNDSAEKQRNQMTESAKQSPSEHISQNVSEIEKIDDTYVKKLEGDIQNLNQ